jgi:branched-chain amino acid transport system permease protein
MVLISFALSAAMGAAAGIVMAPITLCGYDMGIMLGLKGFCAAVLGGLGSSPGSILGGFLLGALEALGAGLISSGFKDAIAFLILLVVLFLRPNGLLGVKEVKRA